MDSSKARLVASEYRFAFRRRNIRGSGEEDGTAGRVLLGAVYLDGEFTYDPPERSMGAELSFFRLIGHWNGQQWIERQVSKIFLCPGVRLHRRLLLLNRMFFVLVGILCLVFPLRQGSAASPAGDGSLVLAALSEDESKFTFRGGQRMFTLPLTKVALLLREDGITGLSGGQLQAAVGLGAAMDDPWHVVPEAEKAQLALSVRPKTEAGFPVTVSGLGALAGAKQRTFTLPAQVEELKQLLAGYARYLTIAFANGKMSLPSVTWKVEVFQPGGRKEREISYKNQVWGLSKELRLPQDGLAFELRLPALLTFSFHNPTRDNYYVYLVNYTSDGQVLPVLPLLSKPDMQNMLPAGGELALSSLRFELDAPVERLRMLLSRVPLDLTPAAQEHFASGQAAETVTASEPAQDGDWAGVEAVITTVR